ncbi:GAF domain-containing protein [Lactobacillus taiwanensis]|uniref:GAF domain-containing protein n=1 Tax=Lactobacillus taiwanensis TaxID=508451 RepID=UPI000B9981AE|nr:GAF domain-containing protein [Lactobacillus taiwanensis]OYR97782.1 histidine kinase [Lactobacillus taiwanensis]OYS01826.1 histidine kinase [Lactobacillus taiwanensis]OYS16593.1 histidine kinase [Lactobacillus taiwanensis]OYS33480.1 histidine kinase [Lactobacillus taiwanensis]OYS34654.1 histidine kinase [Lactobacillus taiwanensis]
MSASTESNYQLLVKQAEALVNGESDWIANAANISALLFNTLNDVNFAGVYRYENNELILGPFQGKPACVHIAIGKGVCGTAAKEKQTQIVENVHEFVGHIACDSDSNSEIVVPIFNRNGALWGVFDFDSTKVANFNELDQKYLEEISNIFKF